MKKILLAVLVLASFVACSNGTSHNDDNEAIYSPTTVTADSNISTSGTYQTAEFYTCDILEFFDEDVKGCKIYSHVVATEAEPYVITDRFQYKGNSAHCNHLKLQHECYNPDGTFNSIVLTTVCPLSKRDDGTFNLAIRNGGMILHYDENRNLVDENNVLRLRLLKDECIKM